MNVMKLYLTVCLLMVTGQSLALFMPADFKVTSDEAVEATDSSGDC